MEHTKSFVRDGKTFYFGCFVKNIWRDDKTGHSFFYMDIDEKPPLEGMYRDKHTAYDKQAKKNVEWYRIFCNAETVSVPLYEEYMPILAGGEFIEKDGRYDFIVSSLGETSAEEQLMVNYLSKNCGISTDQAYQLYKAFNGDVFNGISAEDAVETVQKATGMTQRKSQAIVAGLRESVADREVFSKLAPFGVSYTCVRKAIKYYGDKAYEKLSESPWIRGTRCGMSFFQCDSFAESIGKSAGDSERANVICEFVMDDISKSGHVCCPAGAFTNLYHKYSNGGAFKGYEGIAGKITNNASIRYETIGKKDYVVFVPLLEAEKRIAGHIIRLCRNKKKNPWDSDLVNRASRECGMSYGKQQSQAFTLLSHSGIKILTGGPGTGKTTTLKGLMYGYQEMFPGCKIKLFAPTGRAAQRMSESCGYPAMTVHRGLEYCPYGDSESYKDHNDPIDADLIIVDEMSMMDIQLFDIFLDAVKTGATLLLVGDINQLESVGPGSILHDLIKGGDGLINTVMLTDVFRQGKDSPIIGNAMRINEGDFNLAQCQDFQVIRTEDSSESKETICSLVQEFYDPTDPFRVQVLCPAWKGDAGIDSLNKELQAILNPRPTREKLYYGGTGFGVGDKIIMMQNNYEAEYYNGDIGIVKSVSQDGLCVTIREKNFKIPRTDLGEMALAYAMTIHKSQGSEFPVVITSLPMQPKGMLVRNLLYTAVTRAKEKDIVVTEGNALDISVTTDRSGSRRTFLGHMLHNYVAKGKILYR